MLQTSSTGVTSLLVYSGKSAKIATLKINFTIDEDNVPQWKGLPTALEIYLQGYSPKQQCEDTFYCLEEIIKEY